MGLNILDRIHAKIELFRLEQRYTRRRHRRSTFVSNAIYVDGEYIYQSPNTTGSSSNTSRTNNSGGSSSNQTVADSLPSPTTAAPSVEATKERKRLNRWSSMPGFGSSMSNSNKPSMDPVAEDGWRTQQRRGSFSDVR
ncbi:hypothetical protein B0H66DRAFT_181843 [Apodospora peruviana]|uniref:Uncharacterized protein n=1 Tax=Apodospora peruviana TaxID=516989 RepID=A0AAE0IBV6_9PEZI|nr:hypothetical protein B0H66DRAFT_181843 [Apodospora peruviana]